MKFNISIHSVTNKKPVEITHSSIIETVLQFRDRVEQSEKV